MSAIASQLETIVGSAGVFPWAQVEAALQRQILTAVAPETPIDCVVYPATQAELAEVMACAYQNRWRVLPCGRGSKLHWGGLAAGVQVVISTARLNRLVEHAVGDLTVTAEAGMGFADLQATLTPTQQFLAIDPVYPHMATLGGIVATADTGAWRQRYGGIRDMLIGLSLVRFDGQVAKAGGRVVKNVAGYDLMKLFTGSYGTLGILSQVTFRIYPQPEASQTVVLRGEEEAIAALLQTLLSSALVPTALELITPDFAKALGFAPEMSLIGRFQNLAVSVEQQSNQVMQLGQTLGLKGDRLVAADEAALWQRLREQIENQTLNSAITCKIGVLPNQAVATLNKVNALMTPLPVGLIHAGSGLGWLRFEGDGVEAKTLMELRSHCQSQGGFLTVLEAPLALKQEFDLWGNVGSALRLMQGIKQTFDPENLFSPQRFVGGI